MLRRSKRSTLRGIAIKVKSNNQTEPKGRGGRRPGSGRKKGSATTKTREIADRAMEQGITPLEYMLQVLRDEFQPPHMRLDAAKAAAQYIHPRLQAIEHSGKVSIRTLAEELAELNLDA